MSSLYVSGQMAHLLVSVTVLSITLNILLVIVIGHLLSRVKKNDQAGG